MSLLVRYTLASPDHHDAQTAAMKTLVAGLKAEGISGLNYSCFATEEPTEFIGVLEFPDKDTQQAFPRQRRLRRLSRRRVGPTFANPPQTETDHRHRLGPAIEPGGARTGSSPADDDARALAPRSDRRGPITLPWPCCSPDSAHHHRSPASH